MDLFNSIKEWFTGLTGDAASNLTEIPAVDEIQQQVGETAQSVAGEAETVASQVTEFRDSLTK